MKKILNQLATIVLLANKCGINNFNIEVSTNIKKISFTHFDNNFNSLKSIYSYYEGDLKDYFLDELVKLDDFIPEVKKYLNNLCNF
ncbi:hypothetical protein ACR79R_20240 [Sphingobacterium spiritivorum]|uniref:hypothetical protein n=1 Tax=Sphingobacterium spiritivorum TaxID=258 RepID=UPI003DA1FC34